MKQDYTSIEEENNIINNTKFAKWLSDRGEACSLNVSTWLIESELRKLIALTKKQRLEDLVYSAKVFRNKKYKKEIQNIIREETVLIFIEKIKAWGSQKSFKGMPIHTITDDGLKIIGEEIKDGDY